jgi:hypothetical protein
VESVDWRTVPTFVVTPVERPATVKRKRTGWGRPAVVVARSATVRARDRRSGREGDDRPGPRTLDWRADGKVVILSEGGEKVSAREDG